MNWESAGPADAAFEREIRLWQAYRSRSRDLLEALIDPDALDIGRGGARTREEVVAAVERMDIDDFAFDDMRVLRLGADLEIVVYLSRVAGTYGERPFESSVVMSTSVWCQTEGHWRLVHRVECGAEEKRATD